MSALSHLMNPPVVKPSGGRVVYTGGEPFPPFDSREAYMSFTVDAGGNRLPANDVPNKERIWQWLAAREGKAFLCSWICFGVRMPQNSAPNCRRLLDQLVTEERVKRIYGGGRSRFPRYYAVPNRGRSGA